MAPAQRVGLQPAGHGHWLVGEGERKAEPGQGGPCPLAAGSETTAKQRGHGTMPGEEGAQRRCHCSWRSWKGAGRRGAEHWAARTAVPSAGWAGRASRAAIIS